MTGPHVLVVGGGLAGLAAALACMDAGARVTLVERRNRLGGLTWSFDRNGLSVDNGQHVFLRCCDQYLDFLSRIGGSDEVTLQPRLDIPVLATTPSGGVRRARLHRNGLPAPLHLAGSLLRFPFLPVGDRLRLGRAVRALRRLDLDDPRLDEVTFAEWLASHGQSPAAIAAVWDLITIPTVNLGCDEASLAMGAKVFQTGLLRSAGAADIGWSRVPLGCLHGDNAAAALARGGATVRTGVRSGGVESDGDGYRLATPDGPIDADAVIVAVPHEEAATVLPASVVAHQERLEELGSSAVVDVHLVFDRQVTDYPLMAAHDSPVQWVFDRSPSSGIDSGGQYLVVSLSAADEYMGRRPEELTAMIRTELGRLLPRVGEARLIDSLVTKERHATFRACPGTATLRPGATTTQPGLAVAGAWTRTGWPATMEGAVRSGRSAAAAVLDARRPIRNTQTTEEVA